MAVISRSRWALTLIVLLSLAVQVLWCVWDQHDHVRRWHE